MNPRCRLGRGSFWLALGLHAVGLAGCTEDDGDDGDQVRAVTVGPRSPTAGAGSRDGGIGFVPRPSASRGGGATGSKQALDDLDEDALAALCDELDARFAARIADEQAVRFACALAALTGAIAVGDDGTAELDPAECQDISDRCLFTPATDARAVDCDALAEGAGGCEASVAELTACYDAEIAAVAAAIEPVACALATVEDVTTLLAGLVASSLRECQPIVEQCARLLPGAGPDSSAGPAFDGCSDACESALDGRCDDGGDGAAAATCVFGSDCTDCGPR